MHDFCTMFDSNYLDRALALYESMKRHVSDFRLYAVLFDEKAVRILEQLALPEVIAIRLEDFEDEELRKVKGSRTWTEYMWTSTPSVIRYVLDRYEPADVTYVDADLYFYGSPAPLFEERDGNSVLLTKHHYTPRYDRTDETGVYCVQYLTFRNDERGRHVLEWWRNACLDWCYNRIEDGRFGDQKYLDDWTTRFSGVHVAANRGAGVAPWNIQQFVFEGADDGVRFRLNGTDGRVIFYHFHQLAFYRNGFTDLGIYTVTREQVERIYLPYLLHLERIRDDIAHRTGWDPRDAHPEYKRSWRTPAKWLHRIYLKGQNLYRTKRLLAG